jgi:hypothetical protein
VGQVEITPTSLQIDPHIDGGSCSTTSTATASPWSAARRWR